MNYSNKSFLLLIAVFGIVAFIGSDGSSANSIEAWKKVCEKAAGGHAVKFTGTRAEFFDGKHSWTIFGSTQFDTESIDKPKKWSVGSNPYQILAVKEPISDTAILPFSDPVPNTTSDITLRLNAWRGEYEPVSFVLRSGELSLNQVTIEASDFSHTKNNSRIDRENIDIRVVKCWYQAGIDLRRKPGDKKRLTPEILLHDADLIRVDYENHVNLIKDIDNLKDATKLQPFNVLSNTNQQIWITVRVPFDSNPGLYSSDIIIRFVTGGINKKIIVPIFLNVDERIIPKSKIESALFYLGRYDNTYQGGKYQGSKNKVQLDAELKDILDHGLTNIAILYRYIKGKDGMPDFSRFISVLEAMRRVGFDTKRLLFLDWAIGGAEDAGEYNNKMIELKRIAIVYGFTEIFIYNKDESELPVLMSNRKSFDIPHSLGLKNFVACRPSVASKLEGLLDVAILPRNSFIKDIFCNNKTDISCIKVIPWAYNDPQAGMETPGTYRNKYGLSLIKDGFQGICNYAYQSGSCWDDWAEVRYRPHVMAYPTMAEPLPTLQWEGFREGIDDIRKNLHN